MELKALSKLDQLLEDRKRTRPIRPIIIWVSLLLLLGYGSMKSIGAQTIVDSFPAPGNESRGLAWDGEYLWCADAGTGIVYKLDPLDGTILFSFSFSISAEYGGIAWGYDNTIWIANGSYVYKVDPTNGQTISYIRCPGACCCGNPKAVGLTCESVYLWDSDPIHNVIRKFTTNNVGIYAFNPNDPLARDLAFDSTYIWMIDAFGVIKRFDTTGMLIDSIGGLLSGGWGLTWSNDYLWASSPDKDTIYQISTPPTMEAISEKQGQYYNDAPVLSSLRFTDNFALADGWYQIDSCTDTWILLFTNVLGKEWDTIGWVLPEFNKLSEGSHTIYFKASDDAGNTGGELGEWNWQFYKDVTPPVVFNLIEPADYVWINVTRPTFIWHTALDQISGISKYKIYVDETLRDSSADTLWVANFDLYEGYHDWYVVAYDSAGNYRESEEVLTFGIDTTASIFSETAIWSDTSFQGPYLVTTNVSETMSGVDSVLLYYRFNDGEWQCIPMDVVYDIKYGAEIPKAPNSNTTICYYLKAKDIATNIAFDPKDAPDSVYSFVGYVGIAERSTGTVPAIFALSQNYPNPFSRLTVISYEIPRSTDGSRPSAVNLGIYDLTGRLVRTLVSKPQKPGYYKVSWDGKDDSGKRVINGVYVYRIEVHAGLQVLKYIDTKKMILLK